MKRKYHESHQVNCQKDNLRFPEAAAGGAEEWQKRVFKVVVLKVTR